MKKIIILCAALFSINAIAETMNVNWYVDDSIYDTSTCTVGGDIILPTAPTKRGYTFLGWSATPIPTTEYTPIEYIESTGTQYIDTGYTPVIGDCFEIDYRYTTTPVENNTSTIQTLMSAGTGSYQIILLGSNSPNNRIPVVGFYWKYFANDSTPLNSSPIAGTWYNISTNANGVATSNGATATSSPASNLDGFQTTLWLFKRRNNTYPFYGAIKKFQIKRNNTLIRDFIPVLDPNGVACMYDTVSGEYFYNAGTGDFVAGPAI